MFDAAIIDRRASNTSLPFMVIISNAFYTPIKRLEFASHAEARQWTDSEENQREYTFRLTYDDYFCEGCDGGCYQCGDC